NGASKFAHSTSHKELTGKVIVRKSSVIKRAPPRVASSNPMKSPPGSAKTAGPICLNEDATSLNSTSCNSASTPNCPLAAWIHSPRSECGGGGSGVEAGAAMPQCRDSASMSNGSWYRVQRADEGMWFIANRLPTVTEKTRFCDEFFCRRGL